MFLAADPLHLATIAIVLFLGGVLQSAVGFAYALFATPLIIGLGVPLYKTVAIVATSSLIQAILGFRRLRTEVPRRPTVFAIVVRLVTTVIGILLLRKISTLSVDEIRLIIGCILCCIVGVQFVWKTQPSDTLHPAWGVLAFSTSGLLAGTCGMGGPPLVLWLMANKWSSKRTRAFLFALRLVTIPIQIFLLQLAFGMVILHGVLAGIVLSPSVFLGALIGLPLGNRMPKPVLRRVAFLLLLIIGLNSIIPEAMYYFR